MVDTVSNPGADYAANRMQIRFIGALVVIGVLAIFSQIVLQWPLAGLQDDVRALAVAGRQGASAQQVAKSGDRLVSAGSTKARHDAVEELRDALTKFKRAHAGLREGDASLGIGRASGRDVVARLGDIELPYQMTVSAATTILASSDSQSEFHQAVHRLAEHEAPYLRGIESIADQYEKRILQTLTYAQWLKFAFGLLTLAALALVAVRVFMPAIRQMQRDMHGRERHATEIETSFSVSPIPMFLVDAASLAIVRGNPAAETLIGRSGTEIAEQPFSSLFETRLDANKRFLDKVRAGEAFDAHRVLLIDARRNAVDAVAWLRHLPGSSPRRYLIGITADTRAAAS
jgi:PAS domain-containing protein